MPPELQQPVHAEVERTRARSGWPVRCILAALGVSRSSYYRWLREEAWARPRPTEPIKPVQAYEALPTEKEAVLAYARAHPELRHRELAWRMVDEDVAFVSPSTVYRVLEEARLVCPWKGRRKRRREDHEKASRPDEWWATDLMPLKVAEAEYYFVSFIDEYSRYIVYQELLTGVEPGWVRMDGVTVSVAAQAALETLASADGTLRAQPEIRSDNGSGYISQEFRGVLTEHGLSHHRIKPHCPEENGIMERTFRTFRERLEGEALENLLQARDVMTRIVRWYNEERLHSALGYLRPVDYYQGDPDPLQAVRRQKLAQARHHRREENLPVCVRRTGSQLRQRTLPLSSEEVVACG